MNNSGFVLVELILVISLTALIAGFSVPIYNKFQNTNDLELAASGTAQTLRRAAILAQANERDSQWGVYIENDEIVLFKGSSYSSRDPVFDENFLINKNIIVSGDNQVVFEKLSGYPDSVSTINLSYNNENRQITVNFYGLVSY